MENLIVDREKGTYTFTEVGREYCLTSVTHVIRNILWENPWARDEHLEHGRKVHKATFLLDGGGGGGNTLDWDSLDKSLVGPTLAYQKFKEKEGFVPLLNEENVRSLKHLYAGRPDKLGYFLINKHLRFCSAMVDIKVGKVEPWTGIQLAAYRHAYQEMNPQRRPERIRRLALELRHDGDYFMHLMEDPADFMTFLSAKNSYEWIEKHYPGRRRVL